MLQIQSSGLRRALVAVTIAFIFASFMPTRRAQAAAGDLDPTFGVGGKVVTSFSPGMADVGGIIAQPDGRLVVAGDLLDPSHPSIDFVVLRYDINGNLDPTFGSGGKVTTDFAGSCDRAYGLTQQPDGKLIVVGEAYGAFNPSTVAGFALARYNSDGSLDTSFGVGGKVRTDLADGSDQFVRVAVQSDGKIVAVGHTLNPLAGTDDMVVARYNRDGSLDTSFGANGLTITKFTYGPPFGLAIQPDGRIVVVGAGGSGGLILACYTVNGSLDPTFGNGGKVEGALGLFGAAATLALQPDGKVVVGGLAFTGGPTCDFGLARFLNDGSPDPSFGNGGQVYTDFGPSRDEVRHVIIQPDGKILAIGSMYDSPQLLYSDFALARYNADGSLDTSFGHSGKVTTDFAGGLDFAHGAAVQPGGRVVVVGQTRSADPIFSNIALAAYATQEVTYDVCLQDDSNGNLLQFNSQTGAYLFTNCGGVAMGGTGTLTRRGSLITLQHNAADRRVLATIDTSTHRASASVQSLATGKSFSITDRNTADNTCACK